MDKKKYIQTVTEQIRCKRALPLVTKELEGHIEDQKSDYMKAGMNAEEAEESAVLEMGDPVEVGVEAAGRGIDTPDHAATVAKGSLGIFHGMKSLFLQNEYGQIDPVYSISAGLDYPGIGPEHAYLNSIGRAQYVDITDEEAVCAFEYLSRTEGIIPAIESSHAVAAALKIAPTMDKDSILVINLSGRGDKDVYSIARYREVELNEE